MNLSDAQVERIERLLREAGINDVALKNDLLDHICTDIERSGESFEMALNLAWRKFGGSDSIAFLQRQTRFAVQYREKIRLGRKVHRAKYAFGFIATIAVAFKTMHWPLANILLALAVLSGMAFVSTSAYRHRKVSKMENLTA